MIGALAAGYAAIGAGLGAIALRRRGAIDAVLLVGLWPVYGPFLLLVHPRARALAIAVGRTRAGTLATRLDDAATWLAAIDAALATPTLRGTAAAARLSAMRARLAGELDAIDRAIAELVARIEALDTIGVE